MSRAGERAVLAQSERHRYQVIVVAAISIAVALAVALGAVIVAFRAELEDQANRQQRLTVSQEATACQSGGLALFADGITDLLDATRPAPDDEVAVSEAIVRLHAAKDALDRCRQQEAG